MAGLIRAFDWSNTSLGPVEQWPISLKYSVHHCLLSKFPAALYCGPNFIFIYNDAFIPIVGKKHSGGILGLPCCETRKEIWPTLAPIVHEVFTTGKTIKKENMLQLLDRAGFLEENYLTCSYNPIGLMEAKTFGVYETMHYNTHQIIHERRLRTTKKLAENLVQAKTTEEVYRMAANAFEANDAGIPFALLYELDTEHKNATLKELTRIRPGTDSSPLIIPLHESRKRGTWPIAQVAMSGQSVTVDLSQFPPLPSGRWQEAPVIANVMPLIPNNQTKAIGVLIAGVSAVLSYDDDYSNFHKTIADYITVALGKAKVFEEEIRRRKALTELFEIKNTFFNKVGRELKKPLLFILQTLEDILSDNDLLPIRQIERLTLVKNSMLCLKKMGDSLIADNLPDLSKISLFEIEGIKLHYKSLDVVEITNEIIAMLRNSIARVKLSLPV